MSFKKIDEDCYALHTNDAVYTFATNSKSEFDSLFWDATTHNFENSPQYIGGVKIVPYGANNMLPSQLRDIINENNLAPGIIEKQMGLLWGQGAHLYELSYENGMPEKIWREDKEIMTWLKGWDYESFLKGAVTDYLYTKGFFSAIYLERGHRIGLQPKIERLEHIPVKNARLEWAESRNIKDVKNIFIGDYENSCLTTGVKKYPIYNPKRPGQHAYAATYNHTYSFSRDFYSLPQYWGALQWITRGSNIPTIFKYITENSINVAYHIHSPQEYWTKRRYELRDLHPEWEEKRLTQEINVLVTKMLKNLEEVLTGSKNVGKFIHTIDVTDPDGKPLSWKIESIDQKTKDFIEAQISIHNASISAITSGMGLHPSLSNVIVDGKLSSGSELLYSFKVFLLSDTEVTSSTIFEPINQAIAFNFPNSNLKLGFYHQVLKSEDSLSSSQRVKNNA